MAATLLKAEVERSPKRGRSRWDSRPRSGRVRVFFRVTPEFPAPSGPLCRGSLKCGRLGPAACGEVDHATWTRSYMRPALAEARVLIAEALGQEAFGELGALRYSSNAGCSVCRCSPGFIAEAQGDYDLHVTLAVTR